MTVNIQTVRFEVDKKLLNFVNSKILKLKTFNDSIMRVNVFLKLDNLTRKIKDKVVGIEVHIPKCKKIFISHSSKCFEQSFQSALESVVKNISRQKSKINTSEKKKKQIYSKAA